MKSYPTTCTGALALILLAGCAGSGLERRWQQAREGRVFVAELPRPHGRSSEAAVQAAAAHFNPLAGLPDLNQPIDEYARPLGLWAQSRPWNLNEAGLRMASGVPVLVAFGDRDSPTPHARFEIVAGIDRGTGAVLLRDAARGYRSMDSREFALARQRNAHMLVLCPPRRAAWPMTAADYVDRAAFQRRAGAPGEALRDLLQARALAPENPEILMQLGNLRYAEADLRGAEEYFRMVLERDSNHARACNNLAHILATRNRNLDEALDLSLRAARIQAANPNVMHTLGLVHLARGEAEQAGQILERAAELAAGHPESVRRAIDETRAQAYEILRSNTQETP